jgi:hypothetical protein
MIAHGGIERFSRIGPLSRKRARVVKCRQIRKRLRDRSVHPDRADAAAVALATTYAAGYGGLMPSTRATAGPPAFAQHAPENAMDNEGELALFYDRCSVLMRELLDALAASPDRPRPFPEIEDAMGWPRRRIASVLGGVSHLRHTEFGGRRPYHFRDPRQSASGRWEMWMDGAQARALQAEVERDDPTIRPSATADLRAAANPCDAGSKSTAALPIGVSRGSRAGPQ